MEKRSNGEYKNSAPPFLRVKNSVTSPHSLSSLCETAFVWILLESFQDSRNDAFLNTPISVSIRCF